MEMSLERLSKLLALTTSPEDGEALVAIRKVNKMLKDNRKTWEDILLKKQRPHSRREESPEENWEEILDRCVKNVRGSANLFIQSLKIFYETNGYLTKKQKDALMKFYEFI